MEEKGKQEKTSKNIQTAPSIAFWTTTGSIKEKTWVDSLLKIKHKYSNVLKCMLTSQ